MYLPYTVGKDKEGKERLFYHGIKRTKKSAMKVVEGKRGYIQDYNTKRVVFENML